MILLIDIGNTNIALTLTSGNDIFDTYHINTDPILTADEYYKKIQNFFDLNKIHGCILASVVPTISHIFKDLFEKYLTCKIIIVEPKIRTKVALKADNPKEVGADLIADAAGVFDKEVLIIDLGTATKYIYVKNRTIIGVAISTGVVSSLNSLIKSTALLPQIDLKVPAKILGNNSITSMQSGIIYGRVSELDGMIDKIKKEIANPNLEIIATGGLASLIIPLCQNKITIDPNLLAKGLYNIYLLNTKENE